MIITVPDFHDWKSQPVTKAFFVDLDSRIQDVAGELADTAGIDSLLDRFRVGYIQAIRDIIAVGHGDVEGKEA